MKWKLHRLYCTVNRFCHNSGGILYPFPSLLSPLWYNKQGSAHSSISEKLKSQQLVEVQRSIYFLTLLSQTELRLGGEDDPSVVAQWMHFCIRVLLCASFSPPPPKKKRDTKQTKTCVATASLLHSSTIKCSCQVRAFAYVLYLYDFMLTFFMSITFSVVVYLYFNFVSSLIFSQGNKRPK